MGAFRVGRSDLDFVAPVDRSLPRGELVRLGAVHMGRWTSALVRDVAIGRRWPFMCNGIYVRSGDLARSPVEVMPVAGHVSGRFRIAQREAQREGFDVNLGRRFIAAGVLGARRLHYTLATGEVTTKEATGLYALDVFEPRWRAVIEDAQAYWRRDPSVQPFRRHDGRRRHDAAEFVSCVIDAGNALD